MTEPRLCEYMKHRRVGGYGWVAQYDAMIMERAREHDYVYLSVWYWSMLNELIEELGERELEHICQRLRRRQQDVDTWVQKDIDDGR